VPRPGVPDINYKQQQQRQQQQQGEQQQGEQGPDWCAASSWAHALPWPSHCAAPRVLCCVLSCADPSAPPVLPSWMSEHLLHTLTNVLLELPFSRRAETEADLIGERVRVEHVQRWRSSVARRGRRGHSMLQPLCCALSAESYRPEADDAGWLQPCQGT
jgi:hypothetical protein